jgi:hypothetical protein
LAALSKAGGGGVVEGLVTAAAHVVGHADLDLMPRRTHPVLAAGVLSVLLLHAASASDPAATTTAIFIT